MAVYSLSELRNRITDRIHENHERSISGEDLQEMLLDVLDSLKQYTDDNDQEPAENYYVDSASFDAATGALTLTRAGGITPADVSVDLDGRYSVQNNQIKNDVVAVTAGSNHISFRSSYLAGTEYSVPLHLVRMTDGTESKGIVSNEDEDGFDYLTDVDGDLYYTAIVKQ